MPPEQEEVQAAAPAVAAPAEPTPAPAAEVDDFASAFAELSNPAPAATATKPVAEPTPAPVAEAPAPVVETPVPVVETPAPAYTPPTAEEYAALQAQLAAAKAAPAPAPAPAAEPTPAPAPRPVYSPDEESGIAAYVKEWPDVAANEALIRRGEYNALVTHIFAEVTKQIQPLLDVVPRLEVSTQFRELNELIPDYTKVRDPVLEWVGKQPAYLKTAYEQVTSQGTPEDIADLVERFKKETGWVAPAASAAAAPAAAAPAAAPAAAAKPAAALPTAAAAAVAALKPVRGGRTEPTAAQDPNDFDAAFKEFSATP